MANTKTIYLGNYGCTRKDYPEVQPFDVPEWAGKFIEVELKENLSRMNRIAWVKLKLEILSNMLGQRGTGHAWFVKELKTIIEKIGD